MKQAGIALTLLTVLFVGLFTFTMPLKAEEPEKIRDRTYQIYLEPFEVPLANSKRKINLTVFAEAKGQDNQYRVCQFRARIRDAINTSLWTKPIGTVLVEPKSSKTKSLNKKQPKQKKRARRDLDIATTEKRLAYRINKASGKKGTVSRVLLLKGKVEPRGQEGEFKHRRLKSAITCDRINFREKGIE